QHEYGFFGADSAAANPRLLDFVSRIEKPVILTLHTVTEALLRRTTLTSSTATSALQRAGRICSVAGGTIGAKLFGKAAGHPPRFHPLNPGRPKGRTVGRHPH